MKSNLKETALIALLVFVVVISLFAPSGDANAQAWETHVSTDPLTDERISYIFGGDLGTKLLLSVMCESDGINLLLVHKSADESSYTTSVQARVDKNEAFKPSRWDLHANYRGSWAPMTIVPIWIEQMKSGRSIYVRVEGLLDHGIQQGTISLRGFADAYDRFEDTCDAG